MGCGCNSWDNQERCYGGGCEPRRIECCEPVRQCCEPVCCPPPPCCPPPCCPPLYGGGVGPFYGNYGGNGYYGGIPYGGIPYGGYPVYGGYPYPL